MARPHATWSRHLADIPAERAAPASEAEVVDLVERAAAARRHVKVVGGGHSFSDITLTDGVLVTLDWMRAVIHADASARDPRVAEITIRHLLHYGGGWDRGATFDPVFMPYLRQAAQAVKPQQPQHRNGPGVSSNEDRSARRQRSAFLVGVARIGWLSADYRQRGCIARATPWT